MSTNLWTASRIRSFQNKTTHYLTNISIRDVQHCAEALNKSRSGGSPSSNCDWATSPSGRMGLNARDCEFSEGARRQLQLPNDAGEPDHNSQIIANNRAMNIVLAATIPKRLMCLSSRTRDPSNMAIVMTTLNT